jgi:hypothetical protein
MNKIMKRVLAGVASATEPTYPHTVTDNETLTFTADEEQ